MNQSEHEVREVGLFLFLRGEGKSDFGTAEHPYGPLRAIVEATIEEETREKTVSILEVSCSQHVGTGSHKKSDGPIGRKLRVVPKPRWGVREKAADFASNLPSKNGVCAFFHSDVDFTNRTHNDQCQDTVYEDIAKGIESAGRSSCCRPLVTFPRTEAWLLLLAEDSLSPRQIENMKGNDSAQLHNNPKRLLAQKWPDPTKRYDLVKKTFSLKRMLQLLAFKRFYADLKEILSYAGVN